GGGDPRHQTAELSTRVEVSIGAIREQHAPPATLPDGAFQYPAPPVAPGPKRRSFESILGLPTEATMLGRSGVSRRGFVGGVASALGYLTFKSPLELFGQGRGGAPGQQPRPRATVGEYDAYAKLANNENPYGPPASVMKALTDAFKYANRYGYPDGGITEEIAKHHGVKPE